MLANSVPRRVIQTFTKFRIIANYAKLTEVLIDMEKAAEKNIIRAAHDPSAVVVYDNFDFMNRVRDLRKIIWST
jgi:hypothetical protein